MMSNRARWFKFEVRVSFKLLARFSPSNIADVSEGTRRASAAQRLGMPMIGKIRIVIRTMPKDSTSSMINASFEEDEEDDEVEDEVEDKFEFVAPSLDDFVNPAEEPLLFPSEGGMLKKSTIEKGKIDELKINAQKHRL